MQKYIQGDFGSFSSSTKSRSVFAGPDSIGDINGDAVDASGVVVIVIFGWNTMEHHID